MTQSLRGRLLVGVISLVVIGLLILDVATYTSLQRFLTGRVDDQLLGSHNTAKPRPRTADRRRAPRGHDRRARIAQRDDCYGQEAFVRTHDVEGVAGSSSHFAGSE